MSASIVRAGCSSRPPSAAVEITARRVTAAAVAEQGGSRVVSAHASEPLPPGAVEPGAERGRTSTIRPR